MHTGNLKGTLYCNSDNKSRKNNQKTYKNRKILQASIKTGRNPTSLLCELSEYMKRVSFRFPVRVEGSVTVETACILPIFVIAFLEILSLLQGLTVYSGMLVALQNVSTPISVYGYVYDSLTQEEEREVLGLGILPSFLFSELYLKKKLQEEIQGTDYVKYIDGKEAGVSLIGSYVNRNELSVLVNYKINPSFSITGRAYRMSNRLYLKMWNGYQAEQEEKEEYVYITEYGTVYHLTMDCTHLNLSVQAVSAINLTVERNEYGKKYKACEKCITGNEKTAYYITDKGDKYHEILSCSGLKRTVTCVPESIVEDWPVCSMCGKMGK